MASICSDGHQRIFYTNAGDCPLCDALMSIEHANDELSHQLVFMQDLRAQYEELEQQLEQGVNEEKSQDPCPEQT
jgi:hypothetical protein